MREKVFIYDYFGLAGEDIPAWRETFFWPVPRETTNRIAEDAAAFACGLIEELGETFEGDCLTIGHLVLKDIARVLNHALAVRRLEEEGYRIRTSQRMTLVPRLIGGEPLRLAHPDMWRMAREAWPIRWAKDLFLSLQYNVRRGCLNLPGHFLPGERTFAFPNANVTGRSHVREHPHWVRLTSAEEWLGSGPVRPVPAESRDLFADLARTVSAWALDYAAGTLGYDLGPAIGAEMERFVDASLVHVAEAYGVALDRAGRLKPRRVFSPTGGNPLARTVNSAVRRVGGRATGHPHGYFICHHAGPRHVLQELAVVDEFMAYTPGSVELFQRSMQRHRVPRRGQVAVSHDHYEEHIQRWNRWKDRPLPNAIRTVMVLELSLVSEWAGYCCADAMVNYHFYYALCRSLSSNGYNVIFKKRGKSLGWDGFNIFSDIPNVTVVDDPFEDTGIIDQADAIIVQYAMSSTLYFSMCTNKTVIYVDSGWEQWFPDVYELMAKRCRVLHAWYDERNRECFDESELLELLERRPEAPDVEFMEKYLFP